jgi:hypothetical protein
MWHVIWLAAQMALKRVRLKIIIRNCRADLKISVFNFNENAMCHTTEGIVNKKTEKNTQ